MMLRSRRVQEEDRNLGITLGCPDTQCNPISYFESIQPNVLETALCRSAADCQYGLSCRYIPPTLLAGVSGFRCDNIAQDYVTDVCALDCVTTDSDAATTATTPVVCQDIKTCSSLADILVTTNNPNLVDNPECTKTEDCAVGECRYYNRTNGVLDELKCDDSAGSYCGFNCVDDDRENRNIDGGDNNNSTTARDSWGGTMTTAATTTACTGYRLCASLTDIVNLRTNNINLVTEGACTKADDCFNGECRYDETYDVLVCDDASGTYCDYDCVEDDREVAIIAFP